MNVTNDCSRQSIHGKAQEVTNGRERESMRHRVASAVLGGLLADGEYRTIDELTARAVRITDALLKQLRATEPQTHRGDGDDD